MASKLKYWKEAATLIIAAKAKTPSYSYLGNKKVSCDYRILMLKRTAKSGFFPSAHVFPGGQIDKADFSPEWLDVFKKYGNIHSAADFGHMVDIQGMKPPIMLQNHQSPVPIEVAYRICAIRETFEESGVLLIREASENRPSADVTLGSSMTLDPKDFKHWRKRVHNNAANFLTMCQELKTVPDIWSLAEWSNWLTPSDNKRRFDTMFYLTCVDHIPEASEDNREIIQSQWVTPLESLQLFANGVTYLPPPQVYEIRRIIRFEKFDELAEYNRRRACSGVERYLPVRCNLEDGIISIYPGDELYPDEPVMKTDPSGILQRKETAAEHGGHSEGRNRMVIRSITDYDMVHGIKPTCGHIEPLTDHIPATDDHAKL